MCPLVTHGEMEGGDKFKELGTGQEKEPASGVCSLEPPVHSWEWVSRSSHSDLTITKILHRCAGRCASWLILNSVRVTTKINGLRRAVSQELQPVPV